MLIKSIYISLSIVTTHYKLSKNIIIILPLKLLCSFLYFNMSSKKIHRTLICMEDDIVIIDCFHNIHKIVI
jgi:hypothetical protein